MEFLDDIDTHYLPLIYTSLDISSLRSVRICLIPLWWTILLTVIVH